ncbi:hypothetical protein [Nocardia bovistercoris]|uniref:Peptidase C-terminal archaeal/bacterial domain-containing protein n=1 Tax=Nocardia bovistercoris TaxID=2785916 RepID=A0A931MZX5_9NOCA|nr:hypothetical protein [Nocardia bovistercoris]MBH0776615.1 hypothetical protein [Nocardia bovistercoris]
MSALLHTLRKAAFAMAAIAAAFFVVTAGAGAANASGVYAEIKFAPGTDHGTVGGYINRGYTDVWVLDARAGQLMTVEVISHYTAAPGTALVEMTDPYGRPYPTDTPVSQFQLPATGTYHLTVMSKWNDASYTMNVRIV